MNLLFPWRVDYALEENVLTEKIWFLRAYFTLRGRYTYAHARKTLVLTELSASIDKDPYLCVNEKANGDYSSSVYNRVFSLTWPASTQIYWNKRKRLHKKKDAMERTLRRRG